METIHINLYTFVCIIIIAVVSLVHDSHRCATDSINHVPGSAGSLPAHISGVSQ